jgi:hypothetical protein
MDDSTVYQCAYCTNTAVFRKQISTGHSVLVVKSGGGRDTWYQQKKWVGVCDSDLCFDKFLEDRKLYNSHVSNKTPRR